MAACWKKLADFNDVELLLIVGEVGSFDANHPFDLTVLSGLNCKIIKKNDLLYNKKCIARLVSDFDPDVISVSGWFSPAFSSLLSNAEFKRCRFMLNFDLPRVEGFRQYLARLKVGRLLAKADLIIVPGERAWQVATRLLKIPEGKVRRGLYGIDFETFRGANEMRMGGGRRWPKKFLFIGRYVPIKGIDFLLRAYEEYRECVSQPWPLVCCGCGPLKKDLVRVPGIEDRGFLQADGLMKVFAETSMLVVPSVFEAWGAVIAEAMAAGMPVACTSTCGALPELVIPYYSGLIVPTEDARALCRAMLWAHHHWEQLPQMGMRAQRIAEAFSAELWAIRWRTYCQELLSNPRKNG